MLALVFWTKDRTTSVVLEKNLQPIVSEGNVTSVLYKDDKIYEAKVVKKSYDKGYLTKLTVDKEGNLMTMPKITASQSALKMKGELQETLKQDKSKKTTCDRKRKNQGSKNHQPDKETQQKSRRIEKRNTEDKRQREDERQRQDERQKKDFDDDDKMDESDEEKDKSDEEKDESDEKKDEGDEENDEGDEENDESDEEKDESDEEKDESDDDNDMESENSSDTETSEGHRREEQRREEVRRERERRLRDEELHEEERERNNRRINDVQRRDGPRDRRNLPVLQNEIGEDPLQICRKPGNGRILICEGFNVWIDRAFLTVVNRWKGNPKEMTRRLLKKIVGAENLKRMCARGRSTRYEPIPEDIISVVEYYVNRRCSPGLTPAEFTTAINMMCATLRNPRQ
uniref:BEN domain-containing protein n=1 Tax=Trichogramma kaykai TaxID=54128 RepID=A0ABD2WSX3_9HYME